MSKLTFLTNGDRWHALYVDGEVIQQGHYANGPKTVANACINNGIDEFEKFHIIDKGEYARAEFPGTLEEIRESDDWELK